MKKEIILIAGANGSGKTTFANLYSKTLKLPFVNADEIAKEIQIADEKQRNFEAGELFLKQIKTLLNDNKSFLIESILAGKYMIKFLQTVKEKDYRVNIIYLFLETPELCLERINERVLKGGHSVSEEDVVRRYFRSKTNFWNIYKKFATNWFLIHNSKQLFDRVAMGTGDKYVVKNNHLSDIFLKNVKIKK